MAEDALSKKFLVSNFTNYKIIDSRPVLEQYNELLRILRRFTQHKINMDESIQVSCIIDKLPPSWKDFKHTLKHLKEELTLIELGSHLRVEESLRVQDSDKPKGSNIAGPSVVNRVEHNNSSRYNDNKGKRKHHDTKADPNKKSKVTCWKCGKSRHLKKDCKGGNVGNKANGSGTKGLGDTSFNPLKAFMSTSKLNDSILWHARLGHVYFKKMQDMSKDGDLCDLHATLLLGNKKYFVTLIDDASRKLKVDGTIEKFKARLVIQAFKQKSGIDYFDTYALVARISTIRLLIAMASIHYLIIYQMDVKIYFLNEELEDNVYMNQPLGFIMLGNKNKSSRFSMKDIGEADVILGIRIKHESNGIACSQSHYIEKVLKKFNYSDCTLVSTHLDTCEKLMPNKGLVVSQLEYSRVIGCLIYDMTYTRPGIAFIVGKLSRYTSNPGTQHWQAIQMVLNNTENNSSTSGWVILLGGAVGKEAEWLKNLLLEIPLWVKPMAHIFIRYDSAVTLAKAYSQMYNRKSRHLGVRHSMICELITNEVVSKEFVRSQQNLADHLAKGLARDLVIKIPSESIPSEEVSSTEYLISGLFQFEPSACMLLSGLPDDSRL
nr:zinc finger, CCHC-type [Tanacetum cinerariifolium]